MAFEWQIKILKEQGVTAWNKWREANPIIGPPLQVQDADPREAATSWRAISPVNLRQADLHGINLRGANLVMADLFEADLSNANLYGADLSTTSLARLGPCWANLYRAAGTES